jgi:tRNA threonylcarbamoyladenosine biosynthesis protein TsaB
VLVVGFDTATPAVSVALHDRERVVSEAFAIDARRHSELLAPMIARVMADAGASRGELTGVAVGVGPGPYTGLRVGVVTARVLGAVLSLPVYGVCSLDVIAVAAQGALGGSSPRAMPSRGGLGGSSPRAMSSRGGLGGSSPRTSTAAAGREFLVATDARRREVYWARYDAVGRRVEGPLVSRPGLIPGAADLPVAGTGGQLYPEAFGEVIGPAYPDARVLCGIVAASLGRGPGPEAEEAEAVQPGAARIGAAQTGAAQPPLLAAEPLYLRRPDAREPGPPKRVTPR